MKSGPSPGARAATAAVARGRRAALVALLVVAAAVAGHGQAPADGPQGPVVPGNAAQDQARTRRFAANRVIVKFRSGTGAAARERGRTAVGTARRRALSPVDPGLELLTTTLPVEAAIAALQARPDVEFAEPDWELRHFATSNDPRFTDGSLYGMYGDSSTPANQFGSQAAEVWAKGSTGSSTVYVGVIDEGIYFQHEDLAANIWTNPFDAVDGVDNDGNGFIDDVHGWDFFHGDNSVYDGSASNLDIDSHGTHVSGTIGAVGGNGIGVAGVNWNVRMISAKFLGPDGGFTSDAVLAVNYLTDLKARHGLNIVATNNSWGQQGPNDTYSLALHQAIIRAAKQDILFIAAAGNDTLDNDATANYPSNYATDVAAGSESAASYDAVIAVASITSTGALSSFSSFGATTVDIGAPGSSILSTYPQNTYATISGTSMATPHVTGAVALYKSINPAATAAQIRTAILNQGIATSSLAGKTATGDRLNVGDFATAVDMTISDARVTEGHSGTKNATFTVSLSGAAGTQVTASYMTSDVTAAGGTTVSNTAAITIPSSGSGSPYPSAITVASGFGTIARLNVRLNGFSHAWGRDTDVLLVGPSGQTLMLMSDAGGTVSTSNATLTFDDAGPSLPTAAITTGTYRPTDISDGEGNDTFAGPAPAGPYGSTLASFNGTDPAGQWSLYVRDDVAGLSGNISGGWSLILSTTSSGDYVATSGTVTFAAGVTSRSVSVTVNGDSTVEPSETFKLSLSNSVANITDADGIATIVNDDFTDASLPGLPIKAIHLAELRTAINEARTARGLMAFSFTDSAVTAGSTVIKAVHLVEMRTALAQAYSATNRTPPSYTDPTIVAGQTPPKAAHILELRAAVVALE